MKNLKYTGLLIILLISCKKEPTTIPQEYQETRNARITQLELRDKDFRQEFIYRLDGLLDSVKREGNDTWFPDYPEANILSVSHEIDQIRFHSFYDESDNGLLRFLKVYHNDGQLMGAEFVVRYIPYFPTLYGNKFIYSSQNELTSLNYFMYIDSLSIPYITNIKFDKNKIVEFKLSDYIMYDTLSVEMNDYKDGLHYEFSYSSNNLISPNLKRLINNALIKFVNIGESIENWENLVYGLSNYKFPFEEKDELISKINIKGYSKEDGSLILDSTAIFDYQVDTINKKISFGNQIITYEFVE